MSYQLSYSVSVDYVPDGAGGEQIANSQTLQFFPSASNPGGLGRVTVGYGAGTPVPGGAAPTQANFNTACSNMATDIEAQIAANLARILAFATGGG
jgi:hypothetical protein